MSEHDDDLSRWLDDPLVRALRAPGSSAELAGEKEMVAAYRQAIPWRSVRRVIGRLGVGGTAVVTAVALSSGVAAAAYTQTLPESVQRIAHDVLGPIGVPAPEHHPKARIQTAAPLAPTTAAPAPSPTPTRTATTSPTPSARPSGTPKQSRPSQAPQAAPAPPSPIASPAPSAEATPTATPTSAPPPLRQAPSALSIGLSAARVPVGSPVSVSGVVTSRDGHPLRDKRVALQARRPGHQGWTKVAEGMSSDEGAVILATPSLAENVVLRLKTGNRVTSDPARVIVVPSVAPSVGDGAILVSTVGGRAGDEVVLLRWKRGSLVQLGKTRLDATGSAAFVVEPKRQAVRYVVRLKATRLHAAASARITVNPA